VNPRVIFRAGSSEKFQPDYSKEEEEMQEKMDQELYRVIELYTGTLRGKMWTAEIIAASCAEVHRFFSWQAESGYLPSGSRLLTNQCIRAFLEDDKNLDRSAARNRTIAVLRSFYLFWDRIDGRENNMRWMIPNRREAQKTSSWLDGDQQRLLEGAIDQQLEANQFMTAWRVNWIRSAVLVRLLLHTGMYLEEIRTLTLGDIRLGDSRGMVQVRGRRERCLPVDGPTCTGLGVWLTVRPEGQTDWLWLEGEGGDAHLLSERAIWRACRRMVQLAGLDPIRVSPRILRNTCAHNLLLAGESLQMVRCLMRVSTQNGLRYL
jgi:site-specific recombinase XerD